MHDINSAKGWSLMSSSFRKSFLTHLLIGGVIGILYFIFSHSSFFMNRLINSLFLASFFPLIFGGLRFVKNLGTFDLFIYSHRKLWKYGKHHEKFEEENAGVSLLAFEVYAFYIKSVARSFYSQLLLLWIPMRTKFPLCFLSAFFLMLFLIPFI